MSEQLTDRVLVERVQKGDKKAFDLLVLRYQNKVASLISRYVPSVDVADIVQESFIRAYRGIGSFRGDSAFYTWLYRIAVNTAKNQIIIQNKQPRHSSIDNEDAENFAELNGFKEISTPENLMHSEELQRVIFQAMKSLPEDLRLALSLRELDGLSYEDIASIMDCPIGTVRSRIFRAREVVENKIAQIM